MFKFCASLIIILLLLLIAVVLYFVRKIRTMKQNSYNNLKLIINTINSVRYGNLAARLIIDESTNYPVLAESVNRMVETIQDREKMILEFKNEIVSHNIFLEALINSLTEGFLIVDDDFVIKKMTAESVKYFGEHAEGHKFLDYINLPENVMLKDLSSTDITLINKPDVTLCATVSELKFEHSFDFKYLITVKDISHEKELQKIKNDFIATLAHDLKVPLLAQQKTLDLLLAGKFGEISQTVSQCASLINRSNSEVLELTDILLDTYKIDETGLTLKKQSININNLIKDVAAEMKGLALENSMSINLILDDDFNFEVDEFNLKRVLRNLINNSLSYSTDRIEIYSHNKQDGCSIIIRDFGDGISEEEKTHIFQKFYSCASKFRKVGHGLGLYLSSKIVQAHGGKINVYSEKNIKTDFEIFLPKM